MAFDKLKELMARVNGGITISKRNGRTVVETPTTRAKREAREAGDPALRALMRQSNIDTKHFTVKVDPYKFFREVAKVALLQKQFCRCCENTQVNVVAEMVHLRGKVHVDAPIADVWIRRSSVNPLPHEEPLYAPSQSVEFCASCIDAASTTECWKQSTQIEEATGQLPLIH